MEILEGIKTRRSIRGFKPEPIPKDVMDKILEAVAHTPSYTNTQPWEVVVVSGKKRDELSAILLELAKANAPTHPDVPTPKNWPRHWQIAAGSMAPGGSAASESQGGMRKGEKDCA